MYTTDCISFTCFMKSLIISTILIGILLYTIDVSMIRLPPHIRFRFISSETWDWDIIREQQDREWDPAYFVNNFGCKMPSFPLLTGDVQKYLFSVPKVMCKKPLVKSNSNYLWIALNRTELHKHYSVQDVDQMLCSYRAFARKTDTTNRFDKRIVHFGYGDIVKINDEFIRVICTYGNSSEIYRDYHYFIGRKTPEKTAPNADLINVLVFGIDSVSRLNFHRQMKKTAQILLKDLKAIELFGYNKVGDNTYPNLIPVLSGLDSDELASSCLPSKDSNYDKCYFIWNMYKQRGYTTLFAEDMAGLGVFNYFRGGFKTQATDYNIRPAIIEMEHNIAAQKRANAHLCLGGQRPVDVILDYATKFIYSIGTMPYFSLFWTISYTHDYLNFPQLIDDDFAAFLSNLSNANALNNTFLVLMSDHGIRWGSFRSTYQGMMEERQPFLFLLPPKWFPDKYPSAYKNLLNNRHQLTTHFDLHEMLRDLVNPTTISSLSIDERTKELLEIDPMPRGISLFLPVPSTRTCYLAGISSHWCTCHEKKSIQTTDLKVLKVARMIVRTINQMVKSYPHCQPLSLNSIAFANVGVSNSRIINGDNKTLNHFSDITVRLQTKPGLADFEATVRVYNDGSLEMTGTISRTNLYGKQSQCVDDYKIKLYCFCDSFL